MQAHQGNSGSPPEDPHVLVVDDEPDVADLYAEWLDREYSATAVYDGQRVLQIAEQRTPDVVLLDRRMPGLSGEEVLEDVRDRDVNTRVAMVTAVPPDLDIVELPFDDYLVKPISRSELQDVVGSLLSRSDYSEQVQRYYALCNKRARLEAGHGDDELNRRDEYRGLLSRIETIETRVDDLAHEVTSRADYSRLFMELDA